MQLSDARMKKQNEHAVIEIIKAVLRRTTFLYRHKTVMTVACIEASSSAIVETGIGTKRGGTLRLLLTRRLVHVAL